MDLHTNVQAWRFSPGPVQYDVDGGDAPRRWRGLTREQALDALRLLGCPPGDASASVANALAAVALRVSTPPTLWVAHMSGGQTMWQHKVGVHGTSESVHEQVDSWIEDAFYLTGGVPPGLTKAQRHQLYDREVSDAPIRIRTPPRPEGLSVSDAAPVASRHRISSVDVEVVGWWGPGGDSRFDSGGGGPPRQWLGLNEAQAHAALVMLGCGPGEAAETLEVAGAGPALLLDPPARAVVWVTLIAAGPENRDHLLTVHASQEAAERDLEAWLASRVDLDDVGAFRRERCLIEHRLVLP